MPYNLLIVDDESEIVDWLVRMFNEENLPDLEVCHAYSAREALGILNRMKIDVVLSDIKMPGMSGIELLEKIKISWPLCRVIFLTGYKEFDYVYTAIQNNNVRYLLKNERDEIIISNVKSALQEIESELKDEEIVLNAQKQMDKMLPLLQKEFLQDLILGLYDAQLLTEQKFDELSLPFRGIDSYIMIIGRFDNLPSYHSSSSKNRLFASAKHFSQKYLPYGNSTVCFTDGEYGLVWLIQIMPASDIIPETPLVLLKGSLEYVQAALKSNLGTTISFAISSRCFSLDTARESYNRLKMILGYRLGLSAEVLISDENYFEAPLHTSTENKAIINVINQLPKVKILESLLESGQQEECLSILKTLLEPLRSVKSRNYNPALEIYYSVSLIFLKHINRWNLTEKIAFKIGIHLLTRVDLHKSWNDAVEYLYELTGTIMDAHAKNELDKSTDTVTRIKKYIIQHINEDLTLNRLSDMVHVNPSYLSRLFKNVTGLNLTDFIFETRIEKAKELLLHSSKKVNEISPEVGYDSPNSFARFFKNSVGMTPQEYRDSINDSREC
ncbi:MAG TPA: helix-turn-helix domain-containing protein [Ruminiclostridium sp.]|nr:helix-turn-helix domain-containing protein [Ruminiclostridium sp.]